MSGSSPTGNVLGGLRPPAFSQHLLGSPAIGGQPGETILTGETYKAKSSAKNGIKSVKLNSSQQDRYESKATPKGKFFFVLKAGNREVIGRSEMYESEKSRDGGIESVKANGPSADVVDLAA